MEHLSNSKELFRTLVSNISLEESKDEIESIVLMLLEKRVGLTREQIMAGKVVNVNRTGLFDDIRRINSNEPVQYVIGVADFFGREFLVDPSVLIPRPETEILVTEALSFLQSQGGGQRVLDVGTGSGCIAITLSLELPCEVTAVDISLEALKVAATNAQRLRARVAFKHHDILGPDPIQGEWDVIVSNPPYVRRSEAEQMKPNVRDHEPHGALFVPNEDPLIFYRALASYGKSNLKRGAAIIVEVNEGLGPLTQEAFSATGYDTHLIKDLSGKDRVLRAMKAQRLPPRH